MMGVEGAVKQAQSHCVPLALEQFDQRGGCMRREFDFVHPRFRRDVRRVIHGAARVDDNLTPEVGLLFIPFDIEAVRPGKQLPIHVTRALARIVEAVLRKFDAKPVVRTAVQTGNEALHCLFGKEFQRSKLAKSVGLKVDGHSCIKITLRKRPAGGRGVSVIFC